MILLQDSIRDYLGYLRHEKGAAASTIITYQSWLRRYERWQQNECNDPNPCILHDADSAKVYVRPFFGRRHKQATPNCPRGLHSPEKPRKIPSRIRRHRQESGRVDYDAQEGRRQAPDCQRRGHRKAMGCLRPDGLQRLPGDVPRLYWNSGLRGSALRRGG